MFDIPDDFFTKSFCEGREFQEEHKKQNYSQKNKESYT